MSGNECKKCGKKIYNCGYCFKKLEKLAYCLKRDGFYFHFCSVKCKAKFIEGLDLLSKSKKLSKL